MGPKNIVLSPYVTRSLKSSLFITGEIGVSIHIRTYAYVQVPCVHTYIHILLHMYVRRIYMLMYIILTLKVRMYA